MSHKTWGGRFKKPLDPRVSQFNSSLAFDQQLYKHDLLGSQAHAKMLARQGLLKEEEAQDILSALEEIELEIERGQHPFDESCEDIHMFIEQLLIKKIGDTGKKLHTGRSRNDQVALDLRLYTRDAGDRIKTALQRLDQVIETLVQQHAEDQMPGYTHLQPAQPIYLGQYFAAYQAMFNRDLSRLQDWLERMNYSPLGAGALAGSKLPLDRAWVAQDLGFKGVVENTLDAVSDRDFIIELCSVAAIIMMHLSRLAEDLILWATQEFGFISLDDAFATGSSLMPNKKNPDVLELIRGKSGRIFGHLMGILTVMKGLPLAYNKDMQEDKECLFDTVNTLTACLEILPPFLQSLDFNTQKMHEKTKSGHLDATSVLENLVLEGVPFRDAHHQVGLWVREAIDKNCSLADLLQTVGKDLPKLSPINSQVAIKAIQDPPKTPHLLSGLELSKEAIDRILRLASELKQRPEKFSSLLKDKTLALIFEKPSFRTRLSFARAIQSLGGAVVETVSTTRKSEEPRDLMRVLNGYCDFVMVRTHDEAILEEMASYAKVPLINGLSALRHPCQILADLLTLQEYFGNLGGLNLAYIGDGNNILHSLLELAPQLGINVDYCCPKTKQPNAEILAKSLSLFKERIHSYNRPESAASGAHAVYTDVWTSMGFAQDNEHHFEGFQVNEALMSHARPEAIFMHCMPMERGKEVSLSLPDTAASAIFRQSENRLHVQKALLLFLHEQC